MSHLVRATLAVAVLLALAAGGAASVRAAGELGASVESHLYADEDRTLDVLNRSTVPAVFTFEAVSGWAVEPLTLTLAPDEQASVTVTEIGLDAAPLTIRVRATEPPPEGTQAGEIALEATLYTSRPLDPTVWIIAAVLAFTTAGVLAIGYHRKRRAL